MKTEFFRNENNLLSILIDGELVSQHANVTTEVRAAEIVLREAIERPKRNARYKQFREEVDAQPWTKTVFSIDGNGAFVGYHKPMDRWNGWAKPYFPKSEAKRVCEALSEGGESEYWRHEYREATDTFVLIEKQEGEDVDVTEYPAETIEGVLEPVYSIGASYLVWTDEEEKKFFHKDGSGRDGHYEMTLVEMVEDADLIEDYDDTEDDDRENTVIGFAMNAEIGDEYSDNASTWTRIS